MMVGMVWLLWWRWWCWWSWCGILTLWCCCREACWNGDDAGAGSTRRDVPRCWWCWWLLVLVVPVVLAVLEVLGVLGVLVVDLVLMKRICPTTGTKTIARGNILQFRWRTKYYTQLPSINSWSNLESESRAMVFCWFNRLKNIQAQPLQLPLQVLNRWMGWDGMSRDYQRNKLIKIGLSWWMVAFDTFVPCHVNGVSGWWFGSMEFSDFPIILGMSSSQLTKSIIFQRGRVETTNQIKIIKPQTHLNLTSYC